MQSRIEAGRENFSLEPVALAPVLKEALGLVRPLAQQWEVALAEGEWPADAFVQADRQRVTQALMGRRPAIARVGENTQGVFSDVLSRTLPNGWGFGLPNELFLDQAGKGYDGPGIPPTVAMRDASTSRHAPVTQGTGPVFTRQPAWYFRRDRGMNCPTRVRRRPGSEPTEG